MTDRIDLYPRIDRIMANAIPDRIEAIGFEDAIVVITDAYYANAIEPLEDDVLFHLPLQETTGAVAEDSSPLGNDGSYEDGPLLGQSATPLPPYPLYVALDGGTVEVPGIDLSGTTPWSVSVWCRFDAGSSNGAIWSLSDGTRDQEIRLLWLAGSLFFQREVIAARSIVYGAFTPGNENHVLITYDGSEAVMYVNGASVGTVSDSNAIASATTPFTFNSGSIFGPITGLVLAGVTLFDRALTGPEVSGIYNAGVA
ncbi:MAG: LamG domain-containing protein [Actinomycetota bacterium]|nr:LamG domain-containing protein [Actinomycetota bacterium]